MVVEWLGRQPGVRWSAPEPVVFDEAGPLVEEWFEYWLRECVDPQLRPRTAMGYRSLVRSRIVPSLGAETPIVSLRPRNIRTLHHDILSECSSTTARNAHNVVARALDVAVQEEELARNPARLVAPPRRAFKQLDVPTIGEMHGLIPSLLSHPNGLRWLTALLAGLRQGEMLGLEVARVSAVLEVSWQLQKLPLDANGRLVAPADFEYRHLHAGYYLTRPKSKAGWRTVPLIEPLATALHTHISSMPPNPWELVFTHRGHPIDPAADTKAWRSFATAHFGPGRHVRLHDLRHAAVDLLYTANVPEDLIVEIVGHSTRTMTRSYKSPSQVARLEEAMGRVSVMLEAHSTDGSCPAEMKTPSATELPSTSGDAT